MEGATDMAKTSKKKSTKTPIHLKYLTKQTRQQAAAMETKPKPSTLLAELTSAPSSLAPAIPKIIEFFNMEDTTCATTSVVSVQVPIFQPFPSQLQITTYQPFGSITEQIFFRNNDNVNRRIKVLQPDSPYFEVSAARDPNGAELKQSTVGAGMEVMFIVKFKPQEHREYKCDLVCRTERESFVIPVIAMGPRPVLDFPDDINFGTAAVKNELEKTLIVRNVGSEVAHFNLDAMTFAEENTADADQGTLNVFSASPSDGLVEVGQTVMVTISFTPTTATTFNGELKIEYHGQDVTQKTSYVSLTGEADNVEVFLSHPNILQEPTYISLSSQKTVKVCNRSEIPVRFDWRAFHTTQDEEMERARLLAELDEMQSLEEAELNDQLDAAVDDDRDANPEDSDASLSGDEGMVPPKVRAARAALRQKYRHLKHALQEDEMAFAHENYTIQPAVGEIWANSEIEITVTFKPHVSADYEAVAYLDVVGRDERLPLWINGAGVGPKAGLTFDSLDLGDLFINSIHRYEIAIDNRGDIPCEWELIIPDTHMADIITFDTTEGSLPVDASENIPITLSSTVKLGPFDEIFQFKLNGSDETLSCRFKGCIVGPTFHFDVDTIDFGLISYEFLHSKQIMLYNTSEIPMTYTLNVPQDGKFVKKEFDISPSNGTLEPGQSQLVQMDLISTTVKAYDYALTVSIEGVGENLLSLPIVADCKVPQITVKNKEVDYGDSFIRFPYTQELILVNNDPHLSASYEVISQDPGTTMIAAYEAIPPVGSVPPNSETAIKIRTVGEKLGQFRLPIMISIAGSIEPPLQAALLAQVVGPKISLSHADIKWGPTTCLIDAPRDLIMTNDSEIPAPFKLFLKNARSKFRVDVRDGVLSPRESVVVHVIANLDDTIVHKDQLHVIVSEGDNLMVPLAAKGMGTTLYAHEDLKIIDFGATFTNQQCQKFITIENKGRRPQSLKWINQTIKDRTMSQAAKNKGKEDGKKGKQMSLDPVFIVNPAEIELPPRTHIRFHLIGHTKHKGKMSERLLLETKVLKDKQSRIVFDTEVTADFMNPLLDLSQPNLDFSYTWQKDVPIQTISLPLTMTNKTPLPLDFVLKSLVPFSLDNCEHSLAPQQSSTIMVEFDPGYKSDRQSHKAPSALTAVYRGHPQRDNIELLGDINFPNLDFEYTVINFGCVLNDTTKTMLVKVTNSSTVDTAFSWSFVEDEDQAKNTATTKKPYIPVNQVFDILPIRSCLKPGESEDIEFVYYGHSNRRFKGLTVCEVEGGPEYEISLLGEASQVGFKLDHSLIDFGKVLHTKSEERDFCIINTGKVAFNFSISTHLVSRPDLFDISVPHGKVFPHEKQKITVKFKPGLPEKVFEKLVLEIAHFDPVEFPIYGEGIYCQLHVTLPRDENVNPWGLPLSSGMPSWPEMLEEARCNLVDPDPKLAPPTEDTLPPPPNATSDAPSNLIPPMTASTMGGTASRPMTGASQALSSPGSMSSMGESTRPNTRGSVGMGDSPSRPGSPGSTANPFPILDAYPTFENTAAPMKEPTHIEIEMEANRLIFMKHLKSLAEPAPPLDPASTTGAATVSITEEKKDDLPPVPSTASAKKDKGKEKKDEFIIARHVSDFGHVVLGQTRKRTFKVTNTSAVGQLSWIFDKNLLAGTGFSLEPEKVVRLPEDQAVSFNVTFSAKKNFALGEREVIVPLEVKNGASMIIILRANVTVPELTISQDAVDFGAVWVGCVKRVFLQLKNVSPVNAEWDIKKAMGNTKDELKFKIEPRGGSLAPGQCTNVSVEFMPAEDRPHALKVPLKIANGNKAKNILFTGLGEQVELKLSPSLAEFGPILPKTEGGTSQIITLTNESSKAVEVYSVDFDSAFKVEEEVLMKATGYKEDGVMLLPVRLAGESLAPHILEANEKRLAKEERLRLKEERIAAKQAAAEAAAADGTEISADDAAEAEEEEDEFDDDEMDDTVGLVPATPRFEMATTSRSEGQSTDYLFVGPPLSGKTTIAKKLSSRFGYPVLTLDAVVDEIVVKKSELGKKVRSSLGKRSAAEEKLTARRITELNTIVAEEAEAAAAALAAASKGKKKGAEEPAADPEPTAAQLELTSLQNPTGPSATLMEEIVQWKIESDGCGYGSIFDGLVNKYISAEEAAAVIKKVVPEITLVEIALNEEEYAKKMQALFAEASEDIGELKGEYAELPEGDAAADFAGDDLAPRELMTPVKAPNRANPPMTPMTNMTEIPVSLADIESFTELDDMDLFMLTEQAKRHYWTCRDANRKWRYGRAMDVVTRIDGVWSAEDGIKKTEEAAPAAEGDEAAAAAAEEEKKTEEAAPAAEGDVAAAAEEATLIAEKVPTYFDFVEENQKYRSLFAKAEAPVEVADGDEEAPAPEEEVVEEETPVALVATNVQPGGVLSYAPKDAAAGADVMIDHLVTIIPKPLIDPPEPGAMLTPKPTIRQIVRRPYPRMDITPVFTETKGFEILPYYEEGSKEATAAAEAAAANTPEPVEGEEPTNASSLGRKTRWVVEANSSVKFVVKFHSNEIHRLDACLNFEVVGGGARPFMLPCVGHCEVPTINADPRNVFMNRAKARLETSPPVSKKYIMSRDVYEFGPLLTWKEASLKEPVAEGESDVSKALKETALATNCESFRISNNGSFPTVIDFLFESSRAEGDPHPSVGIFHVEPAHLELEEGDTSDIKVWSFPPDNEKLYDDSLVAVLKNSPFETKFAVSSLGAAPKLDLTGMWTDEAELLEIKAEGLIPPVEPEFDEEGKEKDAPAPDPALVSEKAALIEQATAIRAEPLIDFDRLLLNRSEEKSFSLTNNGVIPLEWKIDAADLEGLEEFRIAPTEGSLLPGEEARIAVGFVAIVEKELNPSVTVHFTDVEGGFTSENEIRCYSQAVSIKAEAYSIKAVAFEEDDESNDGVIDFGQLRVGDTENHKFSLRNRGKYEISYDFSFKRPGISNLFVIEPANGKIEPGAAAEVTVTFTSLAEVSLKNNRDIKCVVSEPHTGEAVENFTVSVSVTSHFSRLRLQPARGINFGAIKYNEEPKVRRFDLKNEGLFEFTFTVTSQEVDEVSMGAIVAATPEGLRLEGQTPGGAVPTGESQIGQFVVTPCGGVLQPGESMGIEIKFLPKESEVFREDLKILVSGCDESDSNITNAAVYECIGESCFPAIVVNDWRSIFEEQTVISSMSEVGESGSNNASTNKTAGNSNAIGKAMFAEDDVLFNYGDVISSTTETDKGTVEKFRISNPDKVNATVSFALEASNGGKADDLSCFTIQPTSWDIPAHEYRYVSVYFRPKEMRTYRCGFKGTVADAHESQEDSKGNTGSIMKFDLSGAGTLPCVNVSLPNEANDAGNLLMPFGNVEMGKSRGLPIHLSNDGVVPCTILFEMVDLPTEEAAVDGADETEAKKSVDCFEFSKAGGSETMQPGEKRQLTVNFKPTVNEEGVEVKKMIKMHVMHNSYESNSLLLSGTPYSNDASIEDLENNELKFDEVDLNSASPKSHVAFTLKSKSDGPLRFEFKGHEHFTFKPATGHMIAGGSTDVHAYFDTKGENKAYKGEEIEFSTTKIEYTEGEGEEKKTVEPSIAGWDSGMTMVRPASEEESAEIETSKSSEEPTPLSFKVVDVVDGVSMIEVGMPEPAYNAAEGAEPRVQPLKCTAIADVTKFECETRSVVFKSAAMFQKRVHRFFVKNNGETQLSYNWSMENVPAYLRPADADQPARPAVPCPFTIEPSEGAITATSEQQFTVTYSPSEVDDFCYIARCKMPGLVVAEDQTELVVSMRGKASRPIVHFELGDQNDYLARRPTSLRNELGLFGQIEASSVRVVEMESRGTRVRNSKRFHVVNPTANSYQFQWVSQGNPSSAWSCSTIKGSILPGKRGEMIFDYTPDETGVAESFFKFHIEGTSVDELFLFTGSVVEPVVAFDRQRLDFGAQLLGGLCSDVIHLVNDESLPFAFSFDGMSMGGAGDVFPGFKRPVLELMPMHGLCPPNGRVPITVNFSPAEEKFHNFNLICNVRKKPNHLTLNLKGEGYAVHTKLLLSEESSGDEEGGGEREMLESKRGVNYVDFGHVHLNEKVTKKLSISNTGKFNCDYGWTRSSNNPMLQILGGKTNGSLKKGSRIEFTLEFAPITETELDGTTITCVIAGRYNYVFQIGGRGVRPNLHFSYVDFDFASRFITAPGAALEPAESVMVVTNRDLENPLSIDCAFVSQRALGVECKPTVLEPGDSLEIPFLFAPREAKDYEFNVPFLVNGTSKQNVAIRGKGVYARLELVDLQQSHIQFGNVVEGNSVSRNVKVVNRSSASLTFNLADEMKVGFGKGIMEYNDVMFFPSGAVTLGPHEACVLQLSFSPEKRLTNFSEDLLVRYAGETRKLLTLSGGATGFEVMLETDALPFGTVMAGSMRTRKLNFENSGDMPARCKWLDNTFGDNFRIEPLEVTVPPQSEFAFTVTFAPTFMSDDVRQEGMRLLVDGSDPLTLTCTGGCVPQPDDTIKTLAFTSSARKENVQTVNVSNPTDKVWTLTPVMKGVHWKGMDEISVPGKGSVDYEVTYLPLSMTGGGEAGGETEDGGEKEEEKVVLEDKHRGSLFFALPSGDALLYNLEGEASAPEPEDRIALNCPAKSMLTIPLTVKNWLRQPQKFAVEIVLSDDSDAGSTFLEGANQIDVPSMASREYPLRFFSNKEGMRGAIVKFINESTGEYMFHEIGVEVGAAAVQDAFKMEAPCRQVAKKIISIDNPLKDGAVTFGEDWWKCDNKNVKLRRIGEMAGNKEGTFELEYRPLVATVGAEKAELSFDIEELGNYKYNLDLVAMPPSAKYQLRFECPLGGKQTETFTFKVFNSAACDLECVLDKPQFFTVEKIMKVPGSEDSWGGQDVRVKVVFEPAEMGEVTDVLKISSKEFGEYECSLVGVCKPQLPQGPFVCKNGGGVDLEFRNVFDTSMKFDFKTDSDAFVCNVAGVQEMGGRSSKAVNIKYTAGAGGRASAKLSVRCQGRSDIPPWIYYLTGEP